MHRESLSITRKLLGTDENPEIASALYNLGMNLRQQHKYDQALEILQQSLEIERRFRGSDSPRVGDTLEGLASIFLAQKRNDKAVPLLRDLLANRRAQLGDTDSAVVALVGQLAGLLVGQKNYEETERLFNAFLSPRTEVLTNCLPLLLWRASFFAMRTRWNESVVDLRHAIALYPGEHNIWHCLAAVLVQEGDLEGYRECCARSVARFAKTSDPLTAHRISKDCLILPSAVTNLEVVVRMAEFSATNTPQNDSRRYWPIVGNALAQYRLDRFAAAEDWAKQGLLLSGTNWVAHLEAQMVLAMAQYQLGEREQARASLAKGRAVADSKLPTIESGFIGPMWLDFIIDRALMHEASELIEGTPPQSFAAGPQSRTDVARTNRLDRAIRPAADP